MDRRMSLEISSRALTMLNSKGCTKNVEAPTRGDRLGQKVKNRGVLFSMSVAVFSLLEQFPIFRPSFPLNNFSTTILSFLDRSLVESLRSCQIRTRGAECGAAEEKRALPHRRTTRRCST
jgi:hypothetical protein